MALLDTIREIEERREKTLNRRQNQVAQGEEPSGMPIDRMALRRAMSRMNDIFQENRKVIKEQRDRQMRMNQAMQRAMAEEQGQGQAPAPEQQAQPQMPQQQQPMAQQAPQGLLGGMGGMMQGNPQQQQMAAPQGPTGPYGG